MSMLRSLLLMGVFALSVFLVGFSLGIQLSQQGHVSGPSAGPSSPNFPATIAALEEQLKTVEATVRSANTPAPVVPQPSQSPDTTLPTPTLRVVTRPTLHPQTEADVAAAIAREYLGGGEVVEVKHEKKYGADVFEVKFRHGSEVYVDVQNRRVLYAEVEPADLVMPPTSTPVPLPTRLLPPSPTSPPPTATPELVATPTPDQPSPPPGGQTVSGEESEEQPEETGQAAEEEEQSPETPPTRSVAPGDDGDQGESQGQNDENGKGEDHDDDDRDDEDD